MQAIPRRQHGPTGRAAARRECARTYDPGTADIDIPAHLIELESAAWAEQRQGALTFAAADAVQAAYREHAAATGVSRLDLEMAVKQAVRRPASKSAG